MEASVGFFVNFVASGDRSKLMSATSVSSDRSASIWRFKDKNCWELPS